MVPVAREPPTTQEQAVQQLGSRDAPVLLRLPFSHYCRKAEWALSHCGIPYRTIDLGLKAMRHVKRANPVERTVPVLVDGTRVIHGSHPILRWADDNRKSDVPSLYPETIRKEVLAWEAWMDREIGPAVRREAYRTLAADPSPYGRTQWQKLRLRLSRPLFRAVLGYLKGDQYEQEDPATLIRAIRRLTDALAETDKGYIFGKTISAADLTTAALLDPILPLGEARGYQIAQGWGEFNQYVRTVRPERTRRTTKRKITEDDWRAFEILNRRQVTLDRPLAGAPEDPVG